ncbi:hypothetical protein ACFWNH_29010 [Rhodococcus qingshengii]|uniref:hypothetical protein n=1 Tax=Rhodococcus qingshengii TaxID=334542 RepID=UPI00364CB48F
MFTDVVETFLYSEIVLRCDDSEVSATYADDPRTTVSIRRIGHRTHEKTPIGTRSAPNIEASIDGRVIVLTPGPAKMLKRSYKVQIEFDGRILTLAAKNLEDSMLLDGTKDNGNNSFGDLTRTHRGSVDVFWAVPFKFMKETVLPPTPSRDDVLIGVCAAAAFGTGGLSASTIAAGFASAIFP